MRRLRLVLALGAALVAMFAVSAPTANASYGKLAQYQVTISQNCDNAKYCLGGQGGLGGTWGWAVFNSDGTGDLQITFCGHAPGLGGGAGHEDVDFYAWSIDTPTACSGSIRHPTRTLLEIRRFRPRRATTTCTRHRAWRSR
jgi:hypothetical protein